MKNEYSIEGVKCGGCASTVKEKLSKLDNVCLLYTSPSPRDS
mgnify:CR=1 FL=1